MGCYLLLLAITVWNNPIIDFKIESEIDKIASVALVYNKVVFESCQGSFLQSYFHCDKCCGYFGKKYLDF